MIPVKGIFLSKVCSDSVLFSEINYFLCIEKVFQLWLCIYSDTFNRLYIDVYIPHHRWGSSLSIHAMAKYSRRNILFGKSFSGSTKSDNGLVIIRLCYADSFPPSILSLCISVAMWGTLIHDLPNHPLSMKSL